MQPNKSVEEIVEKFWEDFDWVTLIETRKIAPTHIDIEKRLREALTSHTNTVLQGADEVLAEWVDGNIGASSRAIYLYMTKGEVPTPFQAPSDSGDRMRCVSLLKARPQWVSRLKEIEGKEWQEQISLIFDLLNDQIISNKETKK